MPDFRVVVSNRTEALVDALCARLSEPRASFGPSHRERIVVGGRGMAVWLNLEIARRLGIASGIEYLYPKNVVAWALSELLPGALGQRAYSGERLFWTVLAKLPALLGEPEFTQLAAYLAGDEGGSKRFQLCQRIAATFDEYLTYRPELLDRWTRARRSPKNRERQPQLSLFASATAHASERWQERLWKVVRAEIGDSHPVLAAQGLDESPLPERVAAERLSVFGLATLPPSFLRVLSRLSQVCPVDSYLLAACRADSYAGRSPVLASSGVVQREFWQVLHSVCPGAGASLQVESRFFPARGERLLQQLQREWLEDSPTDSLLCRSDDQSVSFHSCHGPTREIEVLHDRLLDLIHEQGMAPHEIVVMAPDIDAYAPLIQAVFDRSTDDPAFIPYRISDRRLPADSDVVDGMLELLALVRTRLSSAQVLDFLTQEKVRERFEIGAEELETLQRWVTDSGARSCMDAEHRARFGLPKEEENTWRFALDRLVLGYAVDAEGQELSLGVLPYEEVEGKSGELLGRFVSFTDALFDCVRDLERPRTLAAWQKALAHALGALFAFDRDSAWQHQLVLSALTELVLVSSEADFTGELDLDVVRRLLTERLEQERAARGFLSGGVTFCAMTPMRSIPFRVVWLVGLSDGAFPRASFRPDFNLLERSAEGRQQGDPDRRLDDRCLFLECLLSARERFVASYVGQSIRDNQPLPPAVVVSELIDAITDRAVDETGRKLAVADLVLQHPLQPFSPEYYRDRASETRAALYSYEKSYLRGAELLSGERRQPAPLFDVELDPIADGDIALFDLERFFAAPVDALLRRRLGLDLRERDADVPEREPSVLDGLESYRVGTLVLEHRQAGVQPMDSLALVRATGLLPAGAGGSYEFQRALSSAEPIALRARRIRSVRSHEQMAFELSIDGTRVYGDLGEVYARGLLHVQYARLGAKHLLASWLRHLVLCALGPKGVMLQSTVLGRPETDGVRAVSFEAVGDPIPVLATLLGHYRRGQRAPLLLFPETSYAFVAKERGIKGGTPAACWSQELERSAALRRVFGARVPLLDHGPEGAPKDVRPSFAELAREVFGPLFDHQKEEA